MTKPERNPHEPIGKHLLELNDYYTKKLTDVKLALALENLLDHYISLVESGDAGNWDPEKEKQVIDARKALRLFEQGENDGRDTDGM